VTLVDTSIWADHFRRGNAALARLLADGEAGAHPFVTGELACGNLKSRQRTLADLRRLPQVPVARDNEVHYLLESRRLRGAGLGWEDMHLLASAVLAGWSLLTADRALAAAANALGLPPAAWPTIA